MNKENCALKLVDEIILYYDARSKKHQITVGFISLGRSFNSNFTRNTELTVVEPLSHGM